MTEQSNEEIRIKCAALMGKCTHGPEHWEREGTEGDMELVCKACNSVRSVVRPPDYINDLNAAITLCDRLREEGWVISMDNDLAGQWDVVLTDINKGNHPANMVALTGEQSLPRAICVAFLKTKESK